MKNKDLSISSEVYWPKLDKIIKIRIRQIKLENYSLIQFVLLNGHVATGDINSSLMTNKEYSSIKYYTTLEEAECARKELLDKEIDKYSNAIKIAQKAYENALKSYAYKPSINLID